MYHSRFLPKLPDFSAAGDFTKPELFSKLGRPDSTKHNTAPPCDGAVLVGKPDQNLQMRNGRDEIRTEDSLLAALKDFFKDNPGWE